LKVIWDEEILKAVKKKKAPNSGVAKTEGGNNLKKKAIA